MRGSILIFCFVLAASSAAHANLVINSGFEADDTSGGPVSPPTGWSASGVAGADNADTNSGANDGYIGTGSLSQTIATVPGTTYTIAFFADVIDPTLAGDNAATFDASFDGTDLIGGPIQAGNLIGAYQEFTTDVTAVDASALLTFVGATTSGDGNFYIDDTSVTPAPEPASIVLLAPALVGLLLARRRSARAAA